MKITDEMLVAYLKGGLAGEDRAAVEAAVAADPEVAERLRGHRVIGDLMHGALSGGRVDGPEAPPSRAAAPVVSLEAARARRAEPKPKVAIKPPSRPIDPRWLTIGLSLAAGAIIGLFVPRPESGLMTGRMEATGPLAATLQTRLAAEQGEEASIRIGRSFRSKTGAWCRTFSARDSLAGVACREGDGWRVRMAETGPATSQPSAAVLAAVGGLTDGKPVDSAAEARARASGWR